MSSPGPSRGRPSGPGTATPAATTAGTPRGLTHHPRPPADPTDLARFPFKDVAGTWYRAHAEHSTTGDRGCWYFSSAGTPPESFGRFDLPAPEGTCYLATSSEGAAREKVGTQLLKVNGSESVLDSVLHDAAGRRVIVSTVELASTQAADISVKRAQRWVNRSLWGGTGIYDISQAWASALRQAGFAAIRYPPRFTLGARPKALALFGPAGPPSPPRVTTSHVALGQVLASHGVRVVSPPARPAAVIAASSAPPPL